MPRRGPHHPARADAGGAINRLFLKCQCQPFFWSKHCQLPFLFTQHLVEFFRVNGLADLAGCIVITSYSIHYTKLYDKARDMLSVQESKSFCVFPGKYLQRLIRLKTGLETFLAQSDLPENSGVRILLTGCPVGKGSVITSYSIHYTKLYDAGYLTAYWDWGSCRSKGSEGNGGLALRMGRRFHPQPDSCP